MKLKSVREAAEEIGIGVMTLRRAVWQGEIGHMDIWSRTYVDTDEAAAWYERVRERMTPDRASEFYGVPERWLRQMARSGQLPCETVGNRIFFRAEDLERALKDRMANAADKQQNEEEEK